MIMLMARRWLIIAAIGNKHLAILLRNIIITGFMASEKPVSKEYHALVEDLQAR